ncbi:MAG: hypothetical protein QM755_23565 [Luteolibacter sp.]
MPPSAARMPLVVAVSPEEVHQRVPEIPVEDAQKLRDQFMEEIGNGEIAPEDPTYAPRWARAESEIESYIRRIYGWAAWGSYQHQLALEEYQSQGVR